MNYDFQALALESRGMGEVRNFNLCVFFIYLFKKFSGAFSQKSQPQVYKCEAFTCFCLFALGFASDLE